jgi:glycosyltransferase involved in cell wall biosynthesis
VTISVLHLSASDILGGAAIAAYRLHAGLRRLGLPSRMLVGTKASEDADVYQVTRAKSIPARFSRLLRSSRISFAHRKYERTRSATLERMSDDRAHTEVSVARDGLPADILNLHSIAGFLDHRSFFKLLRQAEPVVWTLHDMNPFTGGCHYSLGCNGFKKRCGGCPQLNSPNSRDITAQIHARKMSAFSRLGCETTQIVTPSAWLASKVRSSSLLGRFDVDCIPYGLDTSIFQPRDRRTAREIFGLPQDRKIVAFAAQNLRNPRKGLDLLLAGLRGANPATVTLVSIGAGGGDLAAVEDCFPLGEMPSNRLMSFALSTADVFVCPSSADNLPNGVIEAMACGIPIVAFSVGGIPELVRSGITGLLAPSGDVAILRQEIETICSDDDMRTRMSSECRRIAVDEYALEVQAGRYRAIYEKLIQKSIRLRCNVRV